MKDKSVLLLTIIAVLTMFTMIVGATFAYFRIFIIEKETSSMDLKSADPAGVVTFVTHTEELYLNITADEMKKEKVGNKYFATNDIEKKYVLEEEEHEFILATANVNSGENKYSCSYEFRVVLPEDNSMIPEDYGEIVINFTGDSKVTHNQTIDIKDLISQKELLLKGYFDEIRFDENVDNAQHVKVEMYIKNENKEQEPFLGNKNLHVRIEPTANVFVCQQIGE